MGSALIYLLMRSATVEVRERDVSGMELKGLAFREEKAFWHRVEIESRNRRDLHKVGMLHCHDEVLRKLNFEEVCPLRSCP